MDAHSSDSLFRLFADACDGRLQPAGLRELEQLLVRDERVRRQYVEFVQLHTDLRFSAQAQRAGQLAIASVDSNRSDADCDDLSCQGFGGGEQQATPTLSGLSPAPIDAQSEASDGIIAALDGAPLGGPHAWWIGHAALTIPAIGAVTLVSLVALFFAFQPPVAPPVAEATGEKRPVMTETDPGKVANRNALPIDGGPLAPDGAFAEYAARVVRVSPDLAWNHPTAPLDFLLRVKTGDKLSIARGLVQMEFASGAKIILHGPAVFTPTSATTGHLESGRMTGEVSDGNFHLTTPAAEVIDLGTEFGVQVDRERATDVVVFNGKVQVVDTAGARESLDMTQGMTARIHSDGTMQYGVDTDLRQFARSIPAVAGDREGRGELSVVDVLCGGDGFNTSLSGAADPQTGRKDLGQRTPSIRRTTGRYHEADWNPILDGVFIPAPEGGATLIDSSGTTIDLPRNHGQTWGPIWARRWESSLQTAGATTDFWGRKTLKNILIRLKQTEFGMIGMHANVAFTIDLRAVRLLQRRDVVEFRGIVANLDNAEEAYPSEAPVHKRIADLRIYVDGELRGQRLGFRRIDGDEQFAVKLEPGDRFLTVVVTDGEGNSAYDHVVLIDPVIVLQPLETDLRSAQLVAPEARSGGPDGVF